MSQCRSKPLSSTRHQKGMLPARCLNICSSLSTGEEDAGPSAKNEGGGTKGEGEVRGSSSGNQSVQSKVYGRHDASVREVPRDGGAAATVLQRSPLRHSQVPERIAGPSVSLFPAVA